MKNVFKKIKNFFAKCWHYIVLIISILFVWNWLKSRGNSGNESGRIADDIRKQQSETEERLRKVESGLDDSIGKTREVGKEIGEVRDELKDSRETIDRVKERNQASSERLDENERIIQELRKRNKKGEK